jgi:hypothetical protein
MPKVAIGGCLNDVMIIIISLIPLSPSVIRLVFHPFQVGIVTHVSEYTFMSASCPHSGL